MASWGSRLRESGWFAGHGFVGWLVVLTAVSVVSAPMLAGCQLAPARQVSDHLATALAPSPPASVVPTSAPPTPTAPPTQDPTRPASPLANPAANLPDTFAATCGSSPGALSVACEQSELRALAQAGQQEGIAQLALPANFLALPADEEMFVLIDEERVSRGLPPIQGLTAGADQQAAAAAVAGSDPPMGGGIVASNWAGDFGPLGAVYDWLYNDGWGGTRGTTTNGSCTSAQAPGCWEHRANLLLQVDGRQLYAGIGCAPWAHDQGVPALDSCALEIGAVGGASPAYSYSWSQVGPG